MLDGIIKKIILSNTALMSKIPWFYNRRYWINEKIIIFLFT